MPSARPKFWARQTLRSSIKGDGGTDILHESYWTTGNFWPAGATLLRTHVTGDLSIGVIWDPAGTPPPGDFISSNVFSFNVLMDKGNSTPTAPTRPDSTSVDALTVWKGQFNLQSSAFGQPFSNGAMWMGHWQAPSSHLAIAETERGPAGSPNGITYFTWLLEGEYAINEAAYLDTYTVGGRVLNWVVSANITIDQLFLGAAS